MGECRRKGQSLERIHPGERSARQRTSPNEEINGCDGDSMGKKKIFCWPGRMASGRGHLTTAGARLSIDLLSVESLAQPREREGKRKVPLSCHSSLCSVFTWCTTKERRITRPFLLSDRIAPADAVSVRTRSSSFQIGRDPLSNRNKRRSAVIYIDAPFLFVVGRMGWKEDSFVSVFFFRPFLSQDEHFPIALFI